MGINMDEDGCFSTAMIHLGYMGGMKNIPPYMGVL
jgi:hypothetical protein